MADEDLYRIGTVAKLTGIAVERLRAWERRYGIAPAHRTGRTRFYDKGQVERLKTLKALIDAGHPISSIAGLDGAQLTQRLAHHQGRAGPRGATAAPAGARTTPAPTVGLIGPNLLVLEQRSGQQTTLEVAARWANVDAFQQEPNLHGELDVLVVQLPVLSASALETLEKSCDPVKLAVFYQFATEGQLAAVRDLGVSAQQWPATWDDIEHVCRLPAGVPLKAARSAPRRFSDADLIAIAADLGADQPGPARALVDAIGHLNALADYALQSAMEEGLDDDWHERTHSRTTNARAQLELALEDWLGLEV